MSKEPPKQVVDVEHVFFLLKPLLEPLMLEIGKLRHDLKPMVDDIRKASAKTFIDSWPAISADVAYEVTYNGYKYLYLYSTQGLTLLTNSGSTITVTANQWTNISLARGTKLTAQGISDSSPVVVLVRATDELLSLSSAGGGGNAVTIADGADVTQGSKGDAAVTSPSSSASVVALLKGILTELEGSGSLTANQGGTWTVQPGNTANTTAWLMTAQQNGTWTVQQGTPPWTQVPNAGTSGGATPNHLISAATTNATLVSAGAHQVYNLAVSNTNAAARYVKLFNKATAPVTGTDTPIKTIQVPANGTVIMAFPVGLAFSLGIGFAATANLADLDNTAIGAGDLSIDLDWK